MAPRILAVVLLLGPLSWIGTTTGTPSPSRATAAALAPLVREPFLQQVSDSSAVIVWASREAGPAEVRYRAPGGPDLTAPAATTFFPATYTAMAVDYYQHQATLRDLAPATTYSYEVLVGGVVAGSIAGDRLTTAPPRGTGTVTFVAFGDSGSGEPPQRQLAEVIAGDSAADRWDLALHTGDVVYPKGTHQLLHDRFFKIYEPWLRRRPVFLAFGNHEEYVANGRPYLDVFALPENGASPQFPDHRERYYSFDYGPVHFIALDSQGSFASGAQRQEQMTWLVRDLEATTQPWRVVIFHRPGIRDTLRPIFERYGVQLVLAGHEHTYVRGVPWREGPASSAPVMHVVTGGGGASLNNPQPAPWVAAWASAFHFVRVTLTDCSPSSSCEMTLQAVGTDGAAFDSMTLPLRQQQEDTDPPTVDWVQPAAGQLVSGTVTVEGDASDDTRVSKVDVWVDGELRLVDASAPYEWAWDTTTELNGDRRLELRAMDIAGRRVASESRVVRVRNPSPSLQLLSPLSGDRVFSGLTYRIRWAAEAGTRPLVEFRVYSSSDGGKTFVPVPGCATLASHIRECAWGTPGPLSSKSHVRVVALDDAGLEVVRTSSKFDLRSGVPRLLLKNPDKPVTFGLGSTQSVSWSSTLGAGATLRVEVSRDAGGSWTTLAPSTLNTTQELPWTVAGLPTAQGLVRVTALNVPLQDVSSGLFKLEPASLRLSGPSASTVWTRGTQVQVKQTSNLGAYDRVNIRLSTDGGLTFPIVLAGGVLATQKSVTVTVPAVVTATARLLVESLDYPEWRAVSPANFTIK